MSDPVETTHVKPLDDVEGSRDRSRFMWDRIVDKSGDHVTVHALYSISV